MIGDELTALDVIGVVVPADFGGQFGVALFGGGVRHAEMMSADAAKENPFCWARNSARGLN